MATTQSNTYTLSFTLNMVKGGETSKRTISFDYDGELTEQTVNNVANAILTTYPKLFQPTQWRDADIAEEEWSTIGVTPSSVVKQTTQYESQSIDDNG